MFTLRIEHAINDYDIWKAAFDRDPVDRRGSRVRHFTVHRPVDDQRYIMIDLDFDEIEDAETMLAKLGQLWRSAAAAPAIAGAPQTRIVETIETVELAPTAA